MGPDQFRYLGSKKDLKYPKSLKIHETQKNIQKYLNTQKNRKKPKNFS